MTLRTLQPARRQWIVEQARLGAAPEAVLAPLLAEGWEQQQAIDAIEEVMREFLADHAQRNSLPVPVPVPAPVGLNETWLLPAGDRSVQVLATLLHPRVVVFGGLLSGEECDQLILNAWDRLEPSNVVNPVTGGDQRDEGRTSQGMAFQRGGDSLLQTLETRISRLLQWPVENGEGLQILRYAPGTEYRPHYDYFDPALPGSAPLLARGGQRVATLVIYLNTPERGGATVFPGSRFEVAAIKGNAVFFSYDRPHPMTLTLHGGAPVLAGEKWIATKWLRERRHD
jgi:prolyl 4-hydroxylase